MTLWSPSTSAGEAIVIFVLTVPAALGCFILAWKKWQAADPKFGSPQWRSIIAFTELCSVTVQGLLFAIMDAYGSDLLP
jgi:hypothetical protein